MSRPALISLALVTAAGCVGADPDPTTSVSDQAATLAFTREHVSGDIYHYELLVPAGDGPNATIRIHRVVRELAPFVPRPAAHAAMLLHGDFSTFITNFAPVLGDPASPVAGLAPYLAAQGIDVWGVDRRWTVPTAPDADVSDFTQMGVAQELDDIRAALALARTLRAGTGSGFGKLALIGFSHGGQLAYAYAAVEAARPAAQRHVGALVPLDFYGAYAAEDEDLRVQTCEFSAFEYQLVADGAIDSPNDFLIAVGQLARTAPDDPSPFFDGATNRDAMLITVGQTYIFAPFAPFYHLASPILDGDVATGLRESSEPAIEAWLEGATAHQAMLESADLDALLCGEGPQPVDAPLSRIRVPLYYIGAAGGIGSLGLAATTRVASTDVTTVVVQRFAPDRRAEDFGHADLLFAADAAALVWQPLATWLGHH